MTTLSRPQLLYLYDGGMNELTNKDAEPGAPLQGIQLGPGLGHQVLEDSRIQDGDAQSAEQK